ncbi:hypothetical protein [Paenibacillus jiagnxiensis]|uniref:hypothetical protein n=1 Tax=Paenibacillus jiagnxiensis TaxID=3228926 RepID=UPI0033B8A93F
MSDLKVLFIYIDGGVKQPLYLSGKDLELWKTCWKSNIAFMSYDGRVGLNPSRISHWHVGDGYTEFFTKPFPETNQAAEAYASVGAWTDKRASKSGNVHASRTKKEKIRQADQTISKEEKTKPNTGETTKYSASSQLTRGDNRSIPLISQKFVNGIRNDFPDELQIEGDTLHRVECKCGAEYYFRRDRFVNITGCKHCNSPVLLDLAKGTHVSPMGLAYTVTNKYYVDRKHWLHKD